MASIASYEPVASCARTRRAAPKAQAVDGVSAAGRRPSTARAGAAIDLAGRIRRARRRRRCVWVELRRRLVARDDVDGPPLVRQPRSERAPACDGASRATHRPVAHEQQPSHDVASASRAAAARPCAVRRQVKGAARSRPASDRRRRSPASSSASTAAAKASGSRGTSSAAPAASSRDHGSSTATTGQSGVHRLGDRDAERFARRGRQERTRARIETLELRVGRNARAFDAVGHTKRHRETVKRLPRPRPLLADEAQAVGSRELRRAPGLRCRDACNGLRHRLRSAGAGHPRARGPRDGRLRRERPRTRGLEPCATGKQVTGALGDAHDDGRPAVGPRHLMAVVGELQA